MVIGPRVQVGFGLFPLKVVQKGRENVFRREYVLFLRGWNIQGVLLRSVTASYICVLISVLININQTSHVVS